MAKKKPAKKPKLYDWGDGKKVHTIDKATHGQNVEAKGYGIDLNAPVAAPLDARGAYGLAQRGADLEFNPQIQAAQGIQKAAPVWFGDYVGQVAASQKAAQDMAAPLLATAQQGVTNAAATAPGLDPSSPQYAKDQQAAQGRQAIAQLGASTLGANATATDAYFGGLQTTAARELPQVQAYYGQKVGDLQGQRGAAVQKNYGDIRTGEQNYGIANATLGLNTSKAAADVDLSRGVDPVTGKALPDPKAQDRADAAAEPNKYGVPAAQWNKWSTSHRQRVIDAAAKKDGPTAADKKAAEKKKTDITKATGKIKTRITEAQTAWERYERARNPVIDPKTKAPIPGKVVKPTPDQIKAQLRKDGYTETEIHVMLMRRVNKPLTKAEIDALKGQDPNIRIPREWLAGKKKAAAPRPPNAPDGYGGSRPT